MGANAGAEPADMEDEEPAGVASVVDALEALAGVLPAGHELFAAVYDRRAQASDVLVRDGTGTTSVRLGLPNSEREALAEMLTSLQDGHGVGDADAGGAEADVTEAMVAEELDYRELVEECPLGLIVIAGDGMIEYASPAAAPILGVDEPDALESLFLAQLLHPEDRERVSRVIERSLAEPDTATLSVRLRRWDGSLVRAEIALRGLFGGERAILALGDAGARPSGVADVLASERRQRALAGAADVGTALISTVGEFAGAVVDLNPQFGLLVGDASGRLVGTAVWELVAAPDATRVRQALAEVIQSGTPRRLEVHLAGASTRRASLILNLDRSSGDPPSLATVLLRDITDSPPPADDPNRASERLERSNRTIERLERQNRELAEFARVAAHDLMAPLRALSGLMDVLAPQLEEQSEDALLAVQTAIGRMLAMVDSAVGFADAQSREPEHVPVDLGDVVDRALAMLGADIVAADAEISVGHLPMVTGDDIQLERLFISLVSNALSYSGEARPEIAIAAIPDGSGWRITVADQGIGVDPEGRDAIFRLFERGAGAPDRSVPPSRAGAGYGIGLATARQIVEHHGGRIWVEPNWPRGSVFLLTLPGA